MATDERVPIAVDVDGVLCDLVAATIPLISAAYGCDLAREHIVMFEMDRVVGVPKQEFDREVFENLPYEGMRPVPGAVEGMRRLARDYRVVVVSSRPGNLAEVTEQWLVSNGFSCDELVLASPGERALEKKRHTIARCDAVIDDDLREAIAAGATGRRAILLDSPWNQSLNARELFRRCRNWDEVVELLTAS